ncbi:MAG TPA: MarR family transcriptional regulator [Acidiphilium sp.]|nr:MAG: MarR family transcriptional regulator [Acidiphilium sp. 21-60-14]OYV92493.1 MAG: MarR family transcriptional regulator [Acidiphilium sp. 37-60-79]OZB40946.1 MAG: MarR family transcriptional regulator [Acidiphilium sp. 34-60-192]HQT87922.1 MarR family transcriptional regulator [Acidiphilium sp.]HQU22694.1 MarR family transcriptional regulator [Acidiphilium sp.]
MFGVADPAVTASVRAYVKLLRATRAVVARTGPLLAEFGLTHTQLGVLEAILHLGPLTQRDLTRKLLTSPGNLTDVIDKLAQRELVTRAPCPEDRRRVRVALTEAGRILIETVFPLHAADIHRAMEGLSQAEQTMLSRLLRHLGQDPAALDTDAQDRGLG